MIRKLFNWVIRHRYGVTQLTGLYSFGFVLFHDIAVPPCTASCPTHPHHQEEDWFESEVSVPFEALAMNFVFNYYEHYVSGGGYGADERG